MGAQCASFGPARRERGLWRGVPQSNATARRSGSFLKQATIRQFCNFCLREAAQGSFCCPTASPQRRDTLPRLYNSSCATQQHLTRRFAICSAVCPKPVLTAPVVSAETATNQQQSPWRTPLRRPQPLRTNRARAGSTAQTKSPKPPRVPRPEVTKGTPAPQQYRRRGSTKKGGGPLRAFLGRPKRKTVYRQTRCGRYEALGAAPSER